MAHFRAANTHLNRMRLHISPSGRITRSTTLTANELKLFASLNTFSIVTNKYNTDLQLSHSFV